MRDKKTNLKLVLDHVETIAIVGASDKSDRDSYKVMKFLKDFGYRIFPVNPNILDARILGHECYPDLSAIEERIDMVDVFRAKEHILSILNDAIKIKAKVFWMQEGLYCEEAEKIGNNMGLKVIMNQCPKRFLKIDN